VRNENGLPELMGGKRPSSVMTLWIHSASRIAGRGLGNLLVLVLVLLDILETGIHLENIQLAGC
jgi:hypothetical protein